MGVALAVSRSMMMAGHDSRRCADLREALGAPLAVGIPLFDPVTVHGVDRLVLAPGLRLPTVTALLS